MRFYKQIEESYIVCIGTGEGNIEITESEYNQIMEVIQNTPTPPDGYDYKLKTDLTWELYELPVEPEPEEPNNDYGVPNDTYNQIIDDYTLSLMESGIL